MKLITIEEFKGTKGKWRKDGIDIFSSINNNEEIAQAYSSSDNGIAEYTKKDWEEAHANAQLIATAPELLDAAINVLEMLSYNKGEEIPEEAWDKAVAHLRETITKA